MREKEREDDSRNSLSAKGVLRDERSHPSQHRNSHTLNNTLSAHTQQQQQQQHTSNGWFLKLKEFISYKAYDQTGLSHSSVT